MRSPIHHTAVVLAGLVSASFAQSTNGPSNSTTAASNNTNPLIPSGISQQCEYFLADLNGNQNLQACTAPVLNALSAFSPVNGGNALPSVNSTLSQLCASGSVQGCSDAPIKQLLSWFSGNCSEELTSGNEVVRSNYDALYIIQPMKSALCARDTKTAEFCMIEITSGTAPSNAGGSNINSTVVQANSSTTGDEAFAVGTDHAAQASFNIQDYAGAALNPANLMLNVAEGQAVLSKRGTNGTPSNGTASTNAAVANSTTFQQANLPYLFLSSQMDSTRLCTQCSQTLLLRYLQWESSIPYPLGVASSGLLGGQPDLWNALSAKCGSGFTAAIEAGTGTNGLGTNGVAGRSDPTITRLISFASIALGLLVL